MTLVTILAFFVELPEVVARKSTFNSVSFFTVCSVHPQHNKNLFYFSLTLQRHSSSPMEN